MENDLLMSKEHRLSIMKSFSESGKTQTAYWNGIKHNYSNYKANPLSKWLIRSKKNKPIHNVYYHLNDGNRNALCCLILNKNANFIPSRTQCYILNNNGVKNVHQRSQMPNEFFAYNGMALNQ